MHQSTSKISLIASLAAFCLSLIIGSPFAAAQQNQDFVIEGEVRSGFLQIPLSGIEVRVYTSDPTIDQTTRTNLAGKFRVVFDLNPADSTLFWVGYIDPCANEAVALAYRATVSPTFIPIEVCSLDEIFCNADFEVLQEPDLSAQFFGLDILELRDHHWDFGDGNNSEEANPTHKYAAAGEYKVTHILSSSDECSDTSFMIVSVDSFSCACPEYFQPVCVTDSTGNVLEFPNPCFAFCEGYTLFESCQDSCTVCPDTIDLVCVRSLAGEITFKNACEAECAGFTDYYQCEPDCFCDDVYDPVCGYADDGTPLRFANACQAKCEGFENLQPCDSCFCPDYFDAIDVCVMTEDGELINFSNPCEAECAGYTEYYFCDPDCNCPFDFEPVCLIGPADGVEYFLNQCFADCQGQEDWIACDTCVCPFIYDPVCVTDSTGVSQWFANECRANCAGYFEFDECEDPCICPEYYDPVCAVNEDGDTIEFSNRCFAKCEGYEPDQIFQCVDISDCACDAVYDPVCVFTDQGVEEFSSACLAICAGYDVFFNCDRACDCPLDGDPVCVELLFGLQIEVQNACWAECLGLTIVDCESDDETAAEVASEMVVPNTRVNKRQLDELLAFPNPFNQTLKLDLPTETQGNRSVDVFDLLGRRLYHREITAGDKLAQLTVDSHSWQNGVYLVRFSTKEGSAVVRVVKE